MTFDLTALAEMEKAARKDWGIVRLPAESDLPERLSLHTEGILPWAALPFFEPELRLACAARNSLPAMLEEIRLAREWLKADDNIMTYPVQFLGQRAFAIKEADEARETYRKIVARNSGG